MENNIPMDNNQELPYFNSYRTAINSGSPFRLTTQARSAQIRLEEIPEDKVILLHNALLSDDLLRWTANNERDLKFITNLLKEHSGFELLYLYMNTNINADDELISVLQTCRLAGVYIARIANVNLDPILRALQHQKILKKLYIFFSPNTHEYEGLACAVSNPNLLDLHLFAEQMTDLGMWTALEPVLSNHTSLKSLAVFSVGGHIGHSLNKILSVNQSIRHLTLSDCYHRTNATDMELLWSGLNTNKVLQQVSFSYFEEGAAAKFFEIMADNKCHVPTIKFVGVVFTDDDIKALNMALRTNTTVVELIIQDSNVLTPHSQPLFDGLVQNTSLKTLRLTYDEYDMASAIILFNAVAQNNGLQELEVLGNNTKANDELCKAMGQMLAKNKSLTKLVMTSSTYNHESMLFIFEALASNTTLRSIDLAYDKPDVVPSLQLSDVPQINHALDNIKIRSLQDEGLEALVQRNRWLKSQVKFKIAILSHNIARSREALTTLPREIWIGVLSMVTHPGLESFESVVRTIFDS